MRNPNRIILMLDLVRRVWQQNPDLRLAQLILNCTDPDTEDAYSLEDDELVRRLQRANNR